MRLSLSIFTSAVLQTAFVACAVLGTWQSTSHTPLQELIEQAPRHVALHIPPPRIIPPLDTTPTPEAPLATTVEETRDPRTPPATPVQKKARRTPPKQVAAPTPPKKEAPAPPPQDAPALKVLVAASDDSDAPKSPMQLADRNAPVQQAQGALLTTFTKSSSPTVVAPSITPPPSSGAQHGEIDRAGALKDYKRLLFSTIDEKKSVPRAARRARLEGTVYLSVTLDHTGEILSVKVRKSSGHDTLDEGAVRTMRELKKLPAPPAALGWTRKTLTIPIRYKIK